jgi:PKHD-type hydroxylase
MILCIADIFDATRLAELRDEIAGGQFVDGILTAGWASRLVKNNEQLASGPAARTSQQLVIDALRANPVFSTAVMPKRFFPPLFARYQPGMKFGTHMDNAIMGDDQLRSDVSITVFLSAPEEYDGGELVMETTAGESAYKLPAGHAVVYPSNMLHRVNEVTRGIREVAVTWAESLIRSADRREVIFDIERVRRTMFERDGKTPEFDLLHKTVSNLRRMWAET